MLTGKFLAQVVACADYANRHAAGSFSLKISWWNSLKSLVGMASDFLTNFTADAGQEMARTPQPIHHALATLGKSPSILATF